MQVIGRSARMARHHKRHETTEINLTSMIDMMTILVFFLLVHGGFVRLAVLELNLPTAQSEATAETPEFQLEVTVRETGIEVGDRATGLLNRIGKTGDDYHLDQLSEYLTQVMYPSDLEGFGAEKFKVFAIKSRVHFRRGFDDSGFAKTILLVEPIEPFLGTVRLDALPYKNVDVKKFYPYGDVSFP